MTALLAPIALPVMTLATQAQILLTPDTLARRGGGGAGLVRLVLWGWRGLTTGNPIAIGMAALGACGVGFWLYSVAQEA